MKIYLKSLTLTALVLCLALPVQAGRKVQSNVGESLDTLTQQIWELKKNNAELSVKLDALSRQIEESCSASTRNSADLISKIDELTQQMLMLSEKLGDANYRLAMLSANRTASPMAPMTVTEAPPVGAATGSITQVVTENSTLTADSTLGVPPPTMATTTPEKVYQNAYADYSRGNTSLAVMGFQDYVARFPGTPLADNALYWVGECFYAEKDYEKAIESFDKMITDYPDGDKVPGAYLKKGYAYLELSQVGQGVVQLQGLIQKYPLTREARLAKQKLEELGLTR